jgi:hypothetical protein
MVQPEWFLVAMIRYFKDQDKAEALELDKATRTGRR